MLSLMLRTAATSVAALGVTLLAGPAAFAGGVGGGSGEGPSYTAGASHVTLSGDYSPAKQASVASPAPLCWWEPIDWSTDLDVTDPQAVKKYWDEEIRPWLTGHAAEGQLAVHYERFQEAIRAVKKGQDITWYQLEVDESQLHVTGSDSDPTQAAGYNEARALDAAGCGSGTQPGRYGPILVTMDWFVTGTQPDPVVKPEALAEYAYEVMDLVEPTLDWNPRIGALNEASLVNLPTWLWVDQPQAVGVRSVTATAGPVSATVTARTDGVSITSPAGTTECGIDAARTAYTRNASEADACTLSFDRASRGYPAGFPVEARTAWTAQWTSNVGESGSLAAKSVGRTTDIPVAESESLVTSVG
ncbi:hypothetical protein [Nocardioides acrostichi]|uniref:Secreted protein n=1 Tax=Nocardioides acrostichi TaxID=2784339 RepID=A0A930Y787_9ACTN|nr:hypothetical protein [Nocardioides acrostichi]MBF4161782.1 hypothetical protein [Nocardioides acrostichi]